MQMLAVLEREYKIIMINRTADPVGKVNNMHENMENFSKEVETTQKTKRTC